MRDKTASPHNKGRLSQEQITVVLGRESNQTVTIGRPLQTTDRGSGDPTRQQSVEYIFRGESSRRRSKEGRIGPVWRYIFTVEVFFLKV